MANPDIIVLFHPIYFLAGVRENITADEEIIREKIRDSVKETLGAFTQNYKQVYIAGWAVGVVSIRAEITQTFYFRIRPFDALGIIF